jgi:hypothetical protein
MVIGAGTALIWLMLKNPFGIHGFIAGIAAAFVVILVGTLLSPAKAAGPIRPDRPARNG